MECRIAMLLRIHTLVHTRRGEIWRPHEKKHFWKATKTLYVAFSSLLRQKFTGTRHIKFGQLNMVVSQVSTNLHSCRSLPVICRKILHRRVARGWIFTQELLQVRMSRNILTETMFLITVIVFSLWILFGYVYGNLSILFLASFIFRTGRISGPVISGPALMSLSVVIQ